MEMRVASIVDKTTLTKNLPWSSKSYYPCTCQYHYRRIHGRLTSGFRLVGPSSPPPIYLDYGLSNSSRAEGANGVVPQVLRTQNTIQAALANDRGPAVRAHGQRESRQSEKVPTCSRVCSGTRTLSHIRVLGSAVRARNLLMPSIASVNGVYDVRADEDIQIHSCEGHSHKNCDPCAFFDVRFLIVWAHDVVRPHLERKEARHAFAPARDLERRSMAPRLERELLFDDVCKVIRPAKARVRSTCRTDEVWVDEIRAPYFGR
jgi:hypothetical protein